MQFTHWQTRSSRLCDIKENEVKKLAALIVAAVLCASLLAALPVIDDTSTPTFALGTPLATPQSPYYLLRTVTASDTALTSTTKIWSTIKDLFVAVPKQANGVRIACYADGDGDGVGNSSSGSFSYKVMTCERNSGARLIGTGTWAIGDLALSHDPVTGDALTYAATETNASKFGELPVVSTTEVGMTASGTANDIGEIRFDLRGAAGLWVEVTSLSSITNLYIIVKWY